MNVELGRTSEEQSKNNTNNNSTLDPIQEVHPSKLFLFRGKPSIKNLFVFDFSIAASIRLTVISTGTIVPSRICFSINSPYFELGLLRSSLSRSPADKCTKLNSYKY